MRLAVLAQSLRSRRLILRPQTYGSGYFAPGPNTCGPHTFTTQGLYATGYPVLALMVMRASRLSVLLGTIVYVTLVSVMILPVDKGYTRTMVDL